MTEYALKLSDAELARYRLMAEGAARMETDLWTAAGVTEGAAVADVGCGPGAMSLVLARLVGPTGQVVAVDGNPETVEVARATAARAEAANITVEVGQADDTGIPPASVDVVMIRHVLAHNGGREQAIVTSAASLVRPGGAVYLVDTDISGVRMQPPDDDLVDLAACYQQWHEQQGNDLSVGLRLGELLAGAGLEDIEHSGRYQIVAPPPGFRPPSWAARTVLVDAGLATTDDVERWSAAFDRLDRATDRPKTFVPHFVAYGRRPA